MNTNPSEQDLRRISQELQEQAPKCDKCGTQYRFIGKGLYERR